MGTARPGERVRARRTQRPSLPDSPAQSEIGHSGRVSTAPPPPGTPYGYPAAPPPRPQKYRTSGWWFALGTGLIVIAIGIAVGVFVWLVAAYLDFDGIVDADGHPHNVTVGTDRDRMLWTDSRA